MVQKRNALLASGIFSLVELSWTFAAYGTPRTTFEQFYILLFYWPLLHEPYLNYMKSYGSIWRIFFFPLCVWLTEIVEGYTLIFFHGFNPGWKYENKRCFVSWQYSFILFASLVGIRRFFSEILFFVVIESTLIF